MSPCREFLLQARAFAKELHVLDQPGLAHRGGDALSRSFKYKLLSGVCDLGGRKVVFRLSMLWRHDPF